MLDFPSVSRKTSGFKNNFLNQVFINFQLSGNLDFNDLKSRAASLFPQYERVSIQPRNLISFKIRSSSSDIISKSENENFIELKTLNGKRKISISDNVVNFQIAGDDYKGFDSFIQNEFLIFQTILNNNKIENVTNLQLRKINLLGYEGVSDVQPLVVTENIFREDLIKSFTYIPNDGETFKRKLDTLHYYYENEKIDLILKYGLIVDSAESGKIILDIDISKKNINCDELTVKIEELNNKLFNVFYWAINDKAKDLLKTENGR